MTPPVPALLAALDATWPPAAFHRAGPWCLREGRGGGKRVCAATLATDWAPADIATAEAAMRALGQTPLFMLRDGEDALDAALAGRGYALVDPVVQYAGRVAVVGATPPGPMEVFPVWPPLAVMRDLWAEAGIGPARIAVMERTTGPRTALMARLRDRVAGTAFVACSGDIAMIHAVEVAPALRRGGAGRTLLRAAAVWAAQQGAVWLALAVTEANAPARALYEGLGMEVVTAYHYRQHPESA